MGFFSATHTHASERSLANPVGVEHFAKSRASTTEGDLTYDVRPSFRIARHERTSKDKHTVTDTLQQQLRTMMSAIQGRKAFVQCAILVAVVLLALTANAAAQEHRRHGGRHSPRPHHGHDPWCDHHHCGWPNHSCSRHGKKWRHIGKKWRQAWG